MPKVAIIIGSKKDWEYMKDALNILKEFGIETEVKILSAHRTLEHTFEFSKKAIENGFEVIIAGAGLAAHLPGVIASITHLPVIGVPIPSEPLKGIDSLLSIVQMPSGIPVATVGIGNSKNAAILAIRILSLKYKELENKLKDYMEKMKKEVLSEKLEFN
ncbi:MAG: 5-(carboxyamino)imidazole ribonucleotide mutase [Candidatus Methanomethylicaceae archaeon]|nr:5-(carboxyamino)imidazole ribonucleotide mutase [Candidatus Verstraetearchaeota archaeon]